MGVARASAWDLAVEGIEEALAGGESPSLARLGRLGQLGSLPSLIAALESGEEPGPLAADFARERHSLGLSPREVVAELLVVGRVLERHGEHEARAALDRCLLAYFERVTGELADRASRDPLTGLLHHRAFHELVRAETVRAQRYRAGLALVLLDLDGFKAVNDTAGHAEGDRLLRAFARALSRTARESDTVGRLGGDEFGALLLAADETAVAAFLARLRERVPPSLEFSAGAAYVADGLADSEALFELADRRLYEAKTLAQAHHQ
ncbi:MAG TPA: GGDEF domain-containing protein [Gaiellaceae bacterium]|jgi:diguanylate cyclase (GGDEF)-like protein|nr:GGDEF domain-containing protein [Gaiellaceae bacterium]